MLMDIHVHGLCIYSQLISVLSDWFCSVPRPTEPGGGGGGISPGLD